MHDCVQRVDGVLACERALAGQHFEQDRAEGKQVGTAVSLTALNLFGRQVAGGPQKDSGERRRAAGAPSASGASFAIPKSRILVMPARVRKTFSGLRSR